MKNYKDMCRETFVDCECIGECHKLVVRAWSDDLSIDLSMWAKACSSSHLSFFESIRIACRALFKRELHEDQMVLYKEEACRLGHWIIDTIKEFEEAKK